MTIEIFILLLHGFLICVVLGANNASACFGANVGAGFVKHSVAAASAAIGVLLGVTLEGIKLSKAIHQGVLTEMNPEITWAIIVTALIVISISTLFHLPLSLSESIVGSAIGIGLGRGISINWNFTSTILVFWILNPVFAALLSIIIYQIILRASSAVKNILMLNYLYGKVTLILSFYVAYVLGANTVGLINGIYAPLIGGEWIVSLAFGAGTALGIYFLSRGITESVGRRIIGLSPTAALVAQLSGALTVHLFTQFGLPVSITQALVGGIFGISLAKKIALINKRMVRNIIAGWILAPIIGALISYLIIL